MEVLGKRVGVGGKWVMGRFRSNIWLTDRGNVVGYGGLKGGDAMGAESLTIIDQEIALPDTFTGGEGGARFDFTYPGREFAGALLDEIGFQLDSYEPGTCKSLWVPIFNLFGAVETAAENLYGDDVGEIQTGIRRSLGPEPFQQILELGDWVHENMPDEAMSYKLLVWESLGHVVQIMPSDDYRVWNFLYQRYKDKWRKARLQTWDVQPIAPTEPVADPDKLIVYGRETGLSQALVAQGLLRGEIGEDREEYKYELLLVLDDTPEPVRVSFEALWVAGPGGDAADLQFTPTRLRVSAGSDEDALVDWGIGEQKSEITESAEDLLGRARAVARALIDEVRTMREDPGIIPQLHVLLDSPDILGVSRMVGTNLINFLESFVGFAGEESA